MPRREVIAAVTGRLFEDGWGKVGGGRGLATARHMARAAQGAAPAFFKLIRSGGCSSAQQLSAQFSYLFSKSVDIHDSSGLFDYSKTLSPEGIERAVARWADDWRGQLNAARTTHLVMSFPRDAKPRHVSLIAGEICKEKLGGRFDYMIAVHTDSPGKNPHAHIIVNRRGQDGAYFALRRGTEYSYETFKEAMVEHARGYGIQLQATSRLQRGHLTYPPTDAQWHLAKKTAAATGTAFEAPVGAPRVGAALARATEDIRDWSLRYRDLASFASAGNLQDLATAFEKAAEILASGGVIAAQGEAYMSLQDDFDRAASDLTASVDRVERIISEVAPNQRPAMERQLAEALAGIEHLQPLGARSRDLREMPSNEGIYSTQNVEGINARLTLEGRDKLTAALDGTGIDPVEVEARMRLGASSAALETRWTQQDVQSVADLRGLDLRDDAHREVAISVVEAAHNRIAQDYGIDTAIERRAAATATETDAIAEYEARFPNGDTRMADDYPDGRRVMDEEAAADEAQVEALLQRYDAAQDLDPAEQMARSRQADAFEIALTSSVGATDAARHDLRHHANPVGADDARRLREAVERVLTRDEIEALKRGDVAGLNGIGSREDQLAMARDYLRATNEPVAQQGLDRVTDQLAALRDQARRDRGHDGGGHE